eukprot:TRINITY_DN439_c0_g1_i1.p1 TRINITY_DN439_c0_g1~~TRINITY_DN439_c0_g1_i1.p1  ORF type:complete len:121 (+),score=8.81 TRINITY_DN439_c0_g1_i1:258-620(+)
MLMLLVLAIDATSSENTAAGNYANLATDKKATTDVTQNDEKEYCDLSGVYTVASDVMRKVATQIVNESLQICVRVQAYERDVLQWMLVRIRNSVTNCSNPFIPCLHVLLYHLNQYLFVYR